MSVIINGGGISGIVLALMLSKFTLGKLHVNLIEVSPSNFSFCMMLDILLYLGVHIIR